MGSFESLLFPPSLPQEIKDRAFRASNGELGIVLGDAQAFLKATTADDIEVLGWELWIIDHAWELENNGLCSAPGYWCGGIPLRNNDVPAVVGGVGDANQTLLQILATDFTNEVSPEWLPSLRVNFTLDN